MKLNQIKIDEFKKETKAIITIQELLMGRDIAFDSAKTIRLVRHADNREIKLIDGKEVKGSLYDLYRNDKGTFLKYQREQTRKKFEKVDYIVSFIGERGTKARFVGVYEVGNKVQSPYNPDDILCDMNIVEAFESLTHRVVIEWGKSTVSWCQDYYSNPKKVTRIDEGFEDADGIPVFKSYADTLLNYQELKSVINSPADNPWQAVLKSVNCIYLINDKATGRNYIGSTYGIEGIFARWETYVNTNGHGDNKELKYLLKNDPAYAKKNFQWSILEVLSLHTPQSKVIERENLYKQKLMSREFGYNKN